MMFSMLLTMFMVFFVTLMVIVELPHGVYPFTTGPVEEIQRGMREMDYNLHSISQAIARQKAASQQPIKRPPSKSSSIPTDLNCRGCGAPWRSHHHCPYCGRKE